MVILFLTIPLSTSNALKTATEVTTRQGGISKMCIMETCISRTVSPDISSIAKESGKNSQLDNLCFRKLLLSEEVFEGKDIQNTQNESLQGF